MLSFIDSGTLAPGTALVLVLLSLIIAVGSSVYYFYISILRACDLGRSGWYTLWYFVPIANLAALIYLLAAKGKADAEGTK